MEGLRKVFCRWESIGEATEGASRGLCVLWNKEKIKGIHMQSEKNCQWLNFSSKQLRYDLNISMFMAQLEVEKRKNCGKYL